MKYFWRKPAKTLIYLLTLFMTVGFFSVPVHATNDGDATNPGGSESGQPAENTDKETGNGNDTESQPLSDSEKPSGSITVNLPAGEDEFAELKKYIKENPGSLVVDVYFVATSSKDPGYDIYPFDPEDPGDFTFSDDIDLNKITDPKEGESGPDSKTQWENIAQDLTEQVQDKLKETPAGINPKVTMACGGNTNSIHTGMYLILAHGADLSADEYFEVLKSEDDSSEQLCTIMTTDAKKYYFMPVLVSTPTKESLDTSADEDWIFDLNVTLKPYEEELEGNLKIIKAIPAVDDRLDDDKVTSVTVVFTIKGYKTKTNDAGETVKDDTKQVYWNVASITVPDEGDSVILEHIPVGTWIEVTEKYSGSGYVPDESDPGPTPAHVIIKESTDEDPAKDTNIMSVTFRNKYNDELKKGYGVMNTYTKTDSETKPWTLEQSDNKPKPAAGGESQ